MNWQKLLDLVKKTGDRLIITDKDEGEAYVVMSLSEYEALIDKVPGQRAMSARETVEEPPVSGPGDFPLESEMDDSSLSDEERFYLEPIE